MLTDPGVHAERRRAQRVPIVRPASLRAGELTIHGTIRDQSEGGVFLVSQILIELGERGLLIVDAVELPVQVVWRGNPHEGGPGMGLSFEGSDEERAAMIDALAQPTTP